MTSRELVRAARLRVANAGASARCVAAVSEAEACGLIGFKQ